MRRITEEKKRLRAALKQKRASISAEEREAWDRAIIARIYASEEYRRAKKLLLYAPMEGEINLMPLVRLAREDGKTVAFPRCDTRHCTLRFYCLEPREKLIPGAYGIAEPPVNAPICESDGETLCILPALSFDPTGARLGYGKGYYDRFLKSFSGTAVGAVYQTMLIRQAPTEAHDVRVTLLFTEGGALRCRHREAEASSTPALPRVIDTIKQKCTEWINRWRGDAKRQTVPAAVGDACTEGTAPKTLPAPHAPAAVVAATFLLLLLSRLIDTGFSNRSNEYVLIILLQLMIFLLPTAAYCAWRGKAVWRQLRLRMPAPRHLWLIFCLLVVMVTGGLLLGILTGGVSSLTGNFTLYDTFVARSNGKLSDMICVVLAYGVLPAFCEELVYRAILCREYERFGVGVSITVSALFFSMLHFSFSLFLSYLFLGAILAAAVYVTRSFFAAVLLHLFYNLFCLFGQPYLSAFYVNAGSNEIFIFCLVVLFLLFSAFAAGEARKIYHVYARENADSSYTVSIPIRLLPQKLWQAIRSPAVAVCAVIWLVMSTVNLFI